MVKITTKTLELFLDGNPQNRIMFGVKRIVNAGYTGRNQEEVQKHIDELKEMGVPAPDKIPTYFPKPARLITCSDCIEAADTDNTGEAEYVLLVAGSEVFVAAGSDHTDREMEKNSILKAKQMYPNIISRAVWRLDDVLDHWDDVMLRAWVGKERKELYQEAGLSALLGPMEIMERVNLLVKGDLDGTVIYSGTVATIGEIAFSDCFELELADGVRKQTLSCRYSVNLMNRFNDSR